MWRNWHEISLQHDESVDVLATAHDLDAKAIVSINHVGADGVIPAGKHVMLPGAPAEMHTPLPVEKKSVVATSSVYIVRRGDTPWNIARSAHIRVDDLMRWNGLASNTTLHLGQRLRLQNPQAAIGVSTVAGGAH